MDDKAELVCTLGIEQEDGWVYQVDEKGVYRTPADNPDARRQWVHKGKLEMEAGYGYFVDGDGNIARMTYEDLREEALAEKLAQRLTPPLSGPLELPTYELASGETYRILSIHGPWAWSILFAGKDIENRSRATPYRGPFLIHASSRKYVGTQLAEARAHIARCSGMPLASVPTKFPTSQILGVVDLEEVGLSHPSPWAEEFGMMNWVLSNPRRLAQPVLEVDGKLNLWSWRCP